MCKYKNGNTLNKHDRKSYRKLSNSKLETFSFGLKFATGLQERDVVDSIIKNQDKL